MMLDAAEIEAARENLQALLARVDAQDAVLKAAERVVRCLVSVSSDVLSHHHGDLGCLRQLSDAVAARARLG